jgi:hypothetical protein
MSDSKEIATIADVGRHFLTAANKAGARDAFLKFNKGKYFCEDEEVPIGTEYTASMGDVAYGWTKFVGGEAVEQNIGRIAEGFVAQSRESLGDTDEAQWEKDSQGKPKDPYALQWYVPLMDEATGEGVVFVSGSKGGQRTIGNLLRTYGRNMHKGNPVIALAVRSYKHPEYGRIESPELKIAGWEKQPSVADEMSDAIPF